MVVKVKKIKLTKEELAELEKENLFRKEDNFKKKFANPHFDVANKLSNDAYRNMNGKDKKIHRGYKEMLKDNE